MIRKTMLETVPARASSPGCSARMIKFASPPSEVMLEAPGVRREPLFEGVMRFRCRRSRTLWNGARRLHRFHRLWRSIVRNMPPLALPSQDGLEPATVECVHRDF